MTNVLLFNIVLSGACLYAFWRGGAPERATALVFSLAALATYVRPDPHLNGVQPVLVLIDVLALVALVGIALYANRFWPIYVCSLQLITVAVHGVKAFRPGLIFWMYIGASGKLAYPTLILLAVGVYRHRRRVAKVGHERDWSFASAPA